MAALTTQSLVAAGTAPTHVAPTVAGDTVEVGSGTHNFYHITNTTTAKTVTLVLDHLTLIGGGTYANKTYALAAPGELWIPLRKEYANDAQNGVGRAKITIDTNTTALCAVVQTG
jgi:hypothetical protein